MPAPDRIYDMVADIQKAVHALSREVSDMSARVGALEKSTERVTSQLGDSTTGLVVRQTRVETLAAGFERALISMTGTIEELDRTKLSMDLPRLQAEQRQQEITTVTRSPRRRRWDRARPYAIGGASGGLLVALTEAVKFLVKHFGGG